MVSHSYITHLDSPFLRLTDVDDLLGKDVEITIREVRLVESASNADRVAQFLAGTASADFFRNIEDPTIWQKRIRDEWE